MTEAVQVALITATATVAVAVLGLAGVLVPILLGLRRRLGVVQEHVANNHYNADGTPLNLRDDLDGKHDFNARILLKIQRDIAWLMRQFKDLRDDVDAIEDTQQKGKTDE